MKQFESLKKMDIDAFADWLDRYHQFDDELPWCDWFNENYCEKCESIMCHYPDSEREFPCAYCEIHDNCKYFPEKTEPLTTKEIIKLWLESEVE